MPIVAHEPNTDNSPWYKIMEHKGQVWNNIAAEVGAEINGSYNAYLLEFNMTQQINGLTLKIYGRRQLTTLFDSAKVTGLLKVKLLSPTNSKNFHLRIARSNAINLLYNLVGSYRNETSTNGFKIRYNSQAALDRILQSNILKVNAINRMQINQHGLTIEAHKLPDNENEVKQLWEFCKTVNYN